MAQEAMTPEFAMFFREAARDYENRASRIALWNNIASGIFNFGLSPESSIRSRIHRLIHRFITFSINHKHHGDKVTKQNLFFLWCILQSGVCCNIPYFLARYLVDSAASPRPGSPICGGHFITHLSRSYGLIVPDLTRSSTCKAESDFTMGYL